MDSSAGLIPETAGLRRHHHSALSSLWPSSRDGKEVMPTMRTGALAQTSVKLRKAVT